MNITLEKAGKRFNRDWIFRDFSFSFAAHGKYAITGPNGSGKSTLLQALSGSMGLSEGEIHFAIDETKVAAEEAYRHIAIVAPYLELIEEMTAIEFLRFHAVFKKLVLPPPEILSIIGLAHAGGKQARYFSSGMKQRLKLAQAIFSDVPVLLLDEPCTNLDAAGYELYHRLIDTYGNDRLVIVSSNDVNEYDFCTHRIDIMEHKPIARESLG